MDDNEAIKQAIESENKRLSALEQNNLKEIELLISDNLHYVHANGIAENKREYMSKLSSGERRYHRFCPVERDAHQENECIFIYGLADMEVQVPRGLVKQRLIYTAVYPMKDSETPKLLSWHSTRVSG